MNRRALATRIITPKTPEEAAMDTLARVEAENKKSKKK